MHEGMNLQLNMEEGGKL